MMNENETNFVQAVEGAIEILGGLSVLEKDPRLADLIADLGDYLQDRKNEFSRHIEELEDARA